MRASLVAGSLPLRVLAAGMLACALACGPADGPDGNPSPPPPAQVPQNVVVITLDTTRADALGAYGQSQPSSPRIDAMATEGVVFEQAVSSIPSTFPSHATLFTGKQPYAHGVRSNAGYRLSAANVTLAELLRDQGHVTRAEVAAPVLAGGKQLDQGFEVYHDPGSIRPILDALADVEEGGAHTGVRSAEEITDAGIAFLRENAAQPFLLWLHYFDAHLPYEPIEPFKSMLADPYLAEVRRMDHHVGRVLDALDDLGLRDRTVVVLTADHGEGRGEHGERTHSFFVYDSTIHVPLIFWGAEVPAGVRVASLVRLVDVMPTLLDLLGLPAQPGVQGVSLRPLFTRPDSDLQLTGYGESIEFALAFGTDPLRFVREGRWKYVHKPDPELFDVVADPDETHNLASRHPRELARLRDRLHTLLAAAPPAPDDVTLELDAEERMQLQALGYVGGVTTADLAARLGSLDLSGPDPTTRIGDVDEYARAWGLVMQSRHEEAVPLFEALAARNPRSLGILDGLIVALEGLGRDEELLPLLRRAIDLDPEAVAPRVDLARRLVARGGEEEAESLLRQALVLDPCAAMARVQLSELLRAGGHERERVELLAGGDDGCRDSVVVRNALAFALATSPDAGLRDGHRALRLAQAAVEETQATHPDYLDTLAAAWAEQGDFDRAVAEQERALALLEGHALPEDVVAGFQRHLELYRAGKPLRGP